MIRANRKAPRRVPGNSNPGMAPTDPRVLDRIGRLIRPPEIAPLEIRENCWNTTEGLIRAIVENPQVKPTCTLFYTGKMLRTMGANTIRALTENPGT